MERSTTDPPPADRPHAAASDAPWVERSRAGDRDAFARIYATHGPLVHAVLLARVPRAEADDLTQEVFVAAWKRLHELREVESLGAWLASIARNRASDWARQRGRRLARERTAARAERVGGADANADRVLEMIRSLPEAHREPVLMRLVAGLTGPQIAQRLGMTHGSVRVNLHRAMTLLRERLREGGQ